MLATKSSISLGTGLAKILADSGISHVFGFPGETSLPFYVGMQKTPGIKHILARCPRCAAYMAESYARLSGQIGVCDAPGGIGSPFAAPALHEAYNSSTPLLLIASAASRGKRWSTSQCDQQGLFRPITKATFLVDHAEKIETTFSEALQMAITPRTGPVFLEIPADVFSAQYEIRPLSKKITADYPAYRYEPKDELVEQAAKILQQAASPLIIAGGGVFLSKAADVLQELIAKTGIPLVTTLNAKGVIPESNPHVIGVTGAKGSLEVNQFVQNADCLLILGSKLGDKTTNGYSWPNKKQIAIHVDIDEKELSNSCPGYIPIKADIKILISRLTAYLSPWRARTIKFSGKKIFWEKGMTHHLCEWISKWLPAESILVADASVASGWAGAAIVLNNYQRLINPRGSGSIGYALPAAIGAAFARPGKKIVVIGGDGGLAIAMHEMETAARYRLPIIYFLLNNCRLGLIDKHAKLLQGKPVSDQFVDLDWLKIAQSFGWQVNRIDNSQHLHKLMPAIFAMEGPVLIDYRISPEEMAPDFAMTLNSLGGCYV